MLVLPILSQRITSRLKQLFDIRKVWSGEASPVIIANDAFSIPSKSVYASIEDTSQTKTVMATRSDRNTYIQAVAIMVQKTNTSGVSTMSVTGVQGGQTITLLRINLGSASSERQNITISLARPILLDRNTVVTISLDAASAAGNQYTTGVYFLEEEAIEAS